MKGQVETRLAAVRRRNVNDHRLSRMHSAARFTHQVGSHRAVPITSVATRRFAAVDELRIRRTLLSRKYPCQRDLASRPRPHETTPFLRWRDLAACDMWYIFNVFCNHKRHYSESMRGVNRASVASGHVTITPASIAMIRNSLLPAVALLSAALLASSTWAQSKASSETSEPRSVGDLRVRDFAVKWMVQQEDLAQIGYYREANRAELASSDPRPRIVLMGDSITFHWSPEYLHAPSRLNLINRGIPGQNTTQMLMRFEDDVVALKPVAVVILGGTNDLRAYVGDPAAAGPGMVDRIARNVTAMVDISQGRGVKVIVCAVPPVGADRERIARDSATIVKVNAWLKAFALSRGLPFVDFHGVLADSAQDMPASLSTDGIHPNADGYHLMWPRLAEAFEQLGLR
jgi:lysophospholipase L1-like esterase